MKKLIILFVATLLGATTVMAQGGRNCSYPITLGNVQYAHHGERLTRNQAMGKALTGALTGKVTIEATKFETDVKSAIVRGLSGSYRFRFDESLSTNSKKVPAGSIVVDAVITNIEAQSETKTYRDKRDKRYSKTYYKGITEVILTFKDIKTGKVIGNPTFTGQGSGSSSYSTSDKAVMDAIDRLSGRITTWLNQYKPLQANLVEGSTVKKNKQKEVYIDLGNREGAYAGLHMGVYVIKNIAGHEASSQIGKIKIEAVEGDDISLCKVISGGKDIKSAIEAGATLRVQTIDK